MTSRDHILQLIDEYGGLIRQETQFLALCRHGDNITATQHKANAERARELQRTYYTEIVAALGDMTVEPEPPEPDPIVMPPTVAAGITNALKGLRHVRP